MGKHVNQSEFNKVKLLQEAGISAKQVAKVLNRSITPINNIFQSKDLQQYNALTAARYLRNQAEKIKEEPQQAIKFTPPERSKDELIVLLRSIDNKLSVLVENMPARKGIFR